MQAQLRECPHIEKESILVPLAPLESKGHYSAAQDLPRGFMLDSAESEAVRMPSQ